MKKYYAVKKGRQPGIYPTWPAAQQQVQGYRQAVFKGFDNLADAQAFMKERLAVAAEQDLAAYSVLLYTDGGSRNHGNYAGGHVQAQDKAAWAYLIKYQGQRYSASAGQWGATNNQMELTAVAQGLQKLISWQLQTQKVLLVADSQYVLNALTKGWLASWQRRNWKKADGQPVLNQALWQQISQQVAQFPHLQFAWTKGHAQNKENNFVDSLLNQTMDQMTK